MNGTHVFCRFGKLLSMFSDTPATYFSALFDCKTFKLALKILQNVLLFASSGNGERRESDSHVTRCLTLFGFGMENWRENITARPAAHQQWLSLAFVLRKTFSFPPYKRNKWPDLCEKFPVVLWGIMGVYHLHPDVHDSASFSPVSSLLSRGIINKRHIFCLVQCMQFCLKKMYKINFFSNVSISRRHVIFVRPNRKVPYLSGNVTFVLLGNVTGKVVISTSMGRWDMFSKTSHWVRSIPPLPPPPNYSGCYEFLFCPIVQIICNIVLV